MTLPGVTPSTSTQQIGAAEREARRAERVGQQFQIDAALLERDDEPEPALPVLEEQALAMAARQAAAQRRRLGDREDRRMRVGPVRDPSASRRANSCSGVSGACGGIARHRHADDAARRWPLQERAAEPSRPGRADVLANPLPSHDIDRPDAGVAQG